VGLIHPGGDRDPGGGGERGNGPHGGREAIGVGDQPGQQGSDDEPAVAPEPVDPDRAGPPVGFQKSA
jgi:hypothetical protein